MENTILYLIIIFGTISIIAWLIGFNFANRKMYRHQYISPLQQEVYQGEQIRGNNHLTIFLVLFILISIMILVFFFGATPSNTQSRRDESVSIQELHRVKASSLLNNSTEIKQFPPLVAKRERVIKRQARSTYKRSIYGIQQISLNSYERAEFFAKSLPTYFHVSIIEKNQAYKVVIVGEELFSFFLTKEEARQFKAVYNLKGFITEFDNYPIQLTVSENLKL